VPGQNAQAAIIGFSALTALVALFVSNPTVQRVMAVAVIAADAVFLLIGDPVLRST